MQKPDRRKCEYLPTFPEVEDAMDFQSLIRLAILVVIVAMSCSWSFAATHDSVSPNVILLMSDDQGWGDKMISVLTTVASGRGISGAAHIS